MNLPQSLRFDIGIDKKIMLEIKRMLVDDKNYQKKSAARLLIFSIHVYTQNNLRARNLILQIL